jgi:hypothetical protein
MAINGITPGRYNPDLIPISADGVADSAYNSETGYVTGEDNKPMDDEEFRYIVFQAIEDSQTYIDSYIAPQRQAAMSYYLGNLFGNEEDGRSQVVMTEVRDTVLAMMPSLLRIFTGGDKLLEFVPKTEEDVEAAEQATDLINYIFMQENSGFRVLHDSIKDALVLKTGILNWYNLDDEVVEYYSYSGLSLAEANMIAQDQDVSVEEYLEETDMMTGEQLISMRVRRTKKTPRYIVECVPPEQFLIDNEAMSIDDAIYVGRRRLVTVSDLVSMGYDRNDVEMNAGTGGFEMNQEVIVRNPADQSFFGITQTSDETTDKVFYVESYIRIDKDGDGIAELHRVCTIGNGAYILHQEVVQSAPFSILSPDPTPHTIFGQSIADQTMDLQLIKSSIMRNTLDSLAQSIHPRTVVVEGQVNMDDVLNNETGAIIRARNAGAVIPFSTPFVGQSALGVMAYLDEVKTQRTGISRTSQGLDADVLQSTTKSAVQAQLSASQDRIEMIARLFSDGLKRCFQGLLQLVVQHQDKAKIMRLRNKFIPVDPRGWDASMDMVVNIALGRGSDEARLMGLGSIVQMQQQAIEKYGPNNPLVDLAQFRNTLAQMTTLQGFQDASQFWKEVNPEEVAAFMQQMSAGANKPDPATLLAQVEAEKIKADIIINASKQELERQKAVSDADFQRDKLIADSLLKAAEIQAKYGTQVDIASIRADIDRQRTEIQEMFKMAQAYAPPPEPAQLPMQQPAQAPMMPPMPPGMM